MPIQYKAYNPSGDTIIILYVYSSIANGNDPILAEINMYPSIKINAKKNPIAFDSTVIFLGSSASDLFIKIFKQPINLKFLLHVIRVLKMNLRN